MAAAVKLTEAEALALVAALENLVGTEEIAKAVSLALPADKGIALVLRREPVKLTKAETVALVKAIVPLIPGATLKAKIAAVLKAARPCFDSAERFNEVTAYVVARLKAYAAGDASQPTGAIPAWDACTRASCWNGKNAAQRMMNILSPAFSQSKYEQYRDWMLSIGCNTAHVFLSNKADGEGGGYCIYGTDWSWTINKAFCDIFRSRIADLRAHGFAVVPWLFADDSGAWNKEAAKNFPKYLADLKAASLLDQASIIVAGLELDEYYQSAQVSALVNAIRKVWSGKVGTHQTSGRFDYSALADVVFYQVNPGKTAAQIKAEAARVVKATGKPLCFFELDRQPNRALCDAALAGGAYAVGNWKGEAVAANEPTDDIDLSTAKWGGGIDGSRAKTTERITGLSFNGKLFAVKTSAGTAAWKPVKDGCNQYSCLAVKRDGKWLASKFDWQRPSNTPRDTKNIVSGYMGWKPISGETVHYFQINLDLNERTNAPGVRWP